MAQSFQRMQSKYLISPLVQVLMFLSGHCTSTVNLISLADIGFDFFRARKRQFCYTQIV